MPLDDVKQTVREAFGCTVNDVILAAVGGAVGAAARPSAASCADRARAQGLLPGVGARRRRNACSSATASRRCSCRSRSASSDPVARLDAVRATTADLKEREQAVGAAALLGLGEYAAPDAARPRRPRRARAAARQPHRHQHPRPAGAALLPGRADARGVPDRAAVAEPHAQRADPLVLRPAALRADRRRRVGPRSRDVSPAASRTRSRSWRSAA